MPDLNDKSVSDSFTLTDGVQVAYIPFAYLLYDLLTPFSERLGVPNFPSLDTFSLVDQVQVALGTTPVGRIERGVGDIFNFRDRDVESIPYGKAFSDAFAWLDSILSRDNNSIADSVSLSDTIVQILNLGLTPTDTVSLSDVVGTFLTGAGPSAADTFSFSDLVEIFLNDSFRRAAADRLQLFDSIQLSRSPNGSSLLFGDNLFLDDQVSVVLNSFGTSYLRRYLNDVSAN